jgi:hypothetical protein
MMKYWKNGVITERPEVRYVINPSREQILSAGWKPYIDELPEYDPFTEKAVAIGVDKGVVQYVIQPLTEEEIRLRKAPQEISQLQGKLHLSDIGLFDTVEGIVEKAGQSTKIYWQTAATWQRACPTIAGVAGQIGMSEQELDEFFMKAAKIK